MKIAAGVLARKEDAFLPSDTAGDWSNPEEAEKMTANIVRKAKIIFDNEPRLKVFIKGNYKEMVKRGHFQ